LNGKNLLAPDTDFNTSEEEIEEARISIMQNTQSASMVTLLRENVEQRKQQLSVLIDENKVNSSKRLAEALASLDDVLLDDEVLQAVKDGIISSKDPAKSYNEYAKATTELYNRMMKQQLSSADPVAPQNAMSGKSIKIAISDASGTTMVDFSGEGG
jgi:uncharacterized protein YpiB (UPF0302 family)